MTRFETIETEDAKPAAAQVGAIAPEWRPAPRTQADLDAYDLFVSFGTPLNRLAAKAAFVFVSVCAWAVIGYAVYASLL
ncbi:MAG: hypothetical protein AAFV62_03850 [Pseudomonadota bacterium]